MAIVPRLSDLELFLLTTPDDTEDAPWMVMADLQVRDVELLKSILRLHIERQKLPWYLASYLEIVMPRPGSSRTLSAAPDLLMAVAADRLRSIWDLRQEGGPPTFVLEVVSKSSRRRDNQDKPKIYGSMGVGEYVIFAPERRDNGPLLSGYHRDDGGHFVPWQTDQRGVLWSRELGELGLYVEERLWLRALDAEGHRLPTPSELATAEGAARVAADAAREAAEAEVAQLREELRRLREERA